MIVALPGLFSYLFCTRNCTGNCKTKSNLFPLAVALLEEMIRHGRKLIGMRKIHTLYEQICYSLHSKVE